MPDSGKCVSVALLIIGTELTDGLIRDSHTEFLTDKLYPLFGGVSEVRIVPDSEILVPSINEMSAKFDLLIVTGGLGPTSDDITRGAVASAAGVNLIFDDKIWKSIQNRYGMQISETNRRQAYYPEGFTPLENLNGSACGFYGKIGSCLTVSLPGPPSEMRPMFDSSVLPVLEKNFDCSGNIVVRGTFFLIAESRLEDLLAEVCGSRDVVWGTRTFDQGVYFYICGSSSDELDELYSSICKKSGNLLVRKGNVRIDSLFVDRLFERNITLAGAESCTGGLISAAITAFPGVSELFKGCAVVYSNEEKVRQLGVPQDILDTFGAVSEEVVSGMLDGIKNNFKSEAGYAVSGVAGPGGGSEEKPVGTVVIGVFVGEKKFLRTFLFSGNREIIRKRTLCAVFLMLENLLSGNITIDNSVEWFYSYKKIR